MHKQYKHRMQSKCVWERETFNFLQMTRVKSEEWRVKSEEWEKKTKGLYLHKRMKTYAHAKSI